MNGTRIIVLLFLLFFCSSAYAQYYISGTVYDITRANLVEGVKVISSNGTIVATDSTGQYRIIVNPGDTLSFFFKGKPTQPFAVNEIRDPQQFDVSLHTRAESKYKVLTDVKVFAKNYRQDSIENRETYKDIFAYRKPRIESSISPTGVAGANLGELINIFRFRRNRQLKAFQQRLESQEQEKYVNHRFSRQVVSRITGMEGEVLDTFLLLYRPSYEFTASSSEPVFNQYIINCWYEYRRNSAIRPRSEDDLN